jgi:hypothetical protein
LATKYVVRNGQRIAVVTSASAGAPKKRRKRSFEYEWIRLPRHWITALANTKSAATYRLAHIILVEAFRQKHCGGKIVLSAATVRDMHKSTRLVAAWELAELGLIKIEVNGKRATVVSKVNL